MKKGMKKTSHLIPAFVLLGLLLQGPLFTSAQAEDMNNMPGMSTNKHATMQPHKGQGSVNKIDVTTGTINLTHGPIKSLGWMGMTMDFKVKNKANLDKIKVGMKVNFEVTKEPDGTFVITTITPLK